MFILHRDQNFSFFSGKIGKISAKNGFFPAGWKNMDEFKRFFIFPKITEFSKNSTKILENKHKNVYFFNFYKNFSLNKQIKEHIMY